MWLRRWQTYQAGPPVEYGPSVGSVDTVYTGLIQYIHTMLRISVYYTCISLYYTIYQYTTQYFSILHNISVYYTIHQYYTILCISVYYTVYVEIIQYILYINNTVHTQTTVLGILRTYIHTIYIIMYCTYAQTSMYYGTFQKIVPKSVCSVCIAQRQRFPKNGIKWSVPFRFIYAPSHLIAACSQSVTVFPTQM